MNHRKAVPVTGQPLCQPLSAVVSTAARPPVVVNVCKKNWLMVLLVAIFMVTCITWAPQPAYAQQNLDGPAKPVQDPRRAPGEEGNVGSDSEGADKPPTIAKTQAEISRFCFACPVAAHIFTASMLYPPRVMAAISDPFKQGISIILALWLLWNVSRIFLPFGPAVAAPASANSMLTRILLVFAVVVVVNSGVPGWKIFWNNVYKPITSASVNFVSEIISTSSQPGDFLQIVRDQSAPPPNPLTTAGPAGGPATVNPVATNVRGCHQTRIAIIDTAIANGLMDQDDIFIKNELECAIHTVQRAFSYGIAVGFNNFQRYPSIGGWLSGISLVLVFAMPMLLFSIMVIDALIKWTMIAVLTPILAGCACFQSTRGYAVTAYKAVLESGLSLVIAAIIAVMLSEMVYFTIVRIQEDRETDFLSSFAPEQIANILEAQNLQEGVDAAVEAGQAAGDGQFLEFGQSGVERYQDTPNRGEAPEHDHHHEHNHGQQPLSTPIPSLGYNEPINDAAMAAEILQDIELGRVEFLQDGPAIQSIKAGSYQDQPLLAVEGFENSPIASGCSPPITNLQRFHTSPIPGGRRRGYHHGLDLLCPEKTPILAMGDGVVIAENYDSACGYGVFIDFDNGWYGGHCHLFTIASVVAGQQVTAGQIIGLVGNTGSSTAPHLHITLRDASGALMDPEDVIYNGGLGAVGGQYASSAGLVEDDAALGFGQNDFWLLLANGVISNHAFRTVIPMSAALLNAPVIAGAAGLAMAGLMGMMGAALREARGFAGGIGKAELKNILDNGMDLADRMGGPQGNALKLMLTKAALAIGEDPNNRTTAPRTGEALAIDGSSRDPYAAANQYAAGVAGAGLAGVAGIRGAIDGIQNTGTNLRQGYADFVDSASAGVANLRNFGDSVASGVQGMPGAVQQGLAGGVENINALGSNAANAISNAPAAAMAGLAAGVAGIQGLGEQAAGNLQAMREAAYEKAKQDLAAFKDFITSEEQLTAATAGGIAMAMRADQLLGNVSVNIAQGAGNAAMQGSMALASGAGNAAMGLSAAALRAAGLDEFVNEFSKESTVGRKAGAGLSNAVRDIGRDANPATANNMDDKLARLQQLGTESTRLDGELNRLNKIREDAEKLAANTAKEKAYKERAIEAANIAIMQAMAAKSATNIAMLLDTTGRQNGALNDVYKEASKDLNAVLAEGGSKAYQQKLVAAQRAHARALDGDAFTEKVNNELLGAYGDLPQARDLTNTAAGVFVGTAGKLSRKDRQEARETMMQNLKYEKSAGRRVAEVTAGTAAVVGSMGRGMEASAKRQQAGAGDVSLYVDTRADRASQAEKDDAFDEAMEHARNKKAQEEAKRQQLNAQFNDELQRRGSGGSVIPVGDRDSSDPRDSKKSNAKKAVTQADIASGKNDIKPFNRGVVRTGSAAPVGPRGQTVTTDSGGSRS